MLLSIEGLDGAGKTTAEQVIVSKYPEEKVITTTEPYESEWLGEQVRDAISNTDAHPLSTLLLFMADHTYHYENVIKPALADELIVVTDRYIDSRYAYQGHGIEDFIDGDPITFIQTLQETEWEVKYGNTDVSTLLRIAEIEMPAEIYKNTPLLGQYFYGLSMLDTPHFNTDFVLGDTLLEHPTDLPGLSKVKPTKTELSWSRIPDITLYLDADVDVCIDRLSTNTEERERFEFTEFLEQVQTNYETLISATDRFHRIDANQPKEEMIADIDAYLDKAISIT